MHPEKRESNIVLGIRPIIEAIKAGKEVDKILMQKNATGDLMGELKKLLAHNRIPIQFVPPEKLDLICQKNRLRSLSHQGVLAFVSAITYHDLSQVIPFVFEKSETPLVLVLDEITDVRNFGAIARTAECSGVHAIVIPKKGSAQINTDAVKTSAGALNHIPVCRVDSLKTTLQFLKESGLQVIACTEKAVDLIQKVDYTIPTAIVMGSEESGISNDIIKTADHLVKIPLFGKIASLNVSVATGVILYEAIRQRG